MVNVALTITTKEEVGVKEVETKEVEEATKKEVEVVQKKAEAPKVVTEKKARILELWGA